MCNTFIEFADLYLGAIAIETVHPAGNTAHCAVELLEMFCHLLFALLRIYTSYIKSKVTGKVRKQQKSPKPPVAIVHVNIYLAFFFLIIPLLLLYIKHWKKYYIWKVGRGIDPKVLLLPGEI